MRHCVTVPKNGDSSALVLTSLPAGYHLTTNSQPWLAITDSLAINYYWQQTALLRLSLYSLGTELIGNAVSNSSFIVTDVLASRCSATARSSIQPFPHNGQCLISHVTILSIKEQHILLFAGRLGLEVREQSEGPATGHLDKGFLGFPLPLSQCWVPSCYCMHLMQPSRLKFIKVKLHWCQSH
jgi:hypothetical protein